MKSYGLRGKPSIKVKSLTVCKATALAAFTLDVGSDLELT
jgi:hypothetical protein